MACAGHRERAINMKGDTGSGGEGREVHEIKSVYGVPTT